jgi:hypothetical protein
VQVERLRPTGSREGPWERLERHKPKAKTTKLYDRTGDQIDLDEIEKIRI